ncbi:MAG: cytochrome b5 domain-containing protein [Acidobacteriota bacterium]
MLKLTEKELEKFDGTGGSRCYIAYRGNIYDVTESPLFADAMHFEHYAGSDLTEAMADAPHGDDVFSEFPIVGTLIR